MYHAVKESEGSHSEEAHMEGDYEVCFDNIVDQEEEYTVSISTGMTSTS